MSETLLAVNNLHIHYTSKKMKVFAVNGVSFELGVGESLGIVGETGAGKTTTALSIMGLIPNPPGVIDEGSILFNQRDILQMKDKELRKIRGNQISMIFQDPMTSLNPIMKIGDQIAEVVRQHRKLSGKAAEQEAKRMLEMVGISSERYYEYPHQFSGGMKQRVVIAIALACNPQLLIADEPTTALDVTIQAQVMELMNDLKRELKTSLILITHDLGIVAEICDKVAIMYAGEILESGSLEDIYNHPSHPYTKGLFDSIPSLDEEVERLKPIKGMMPDPTDLPNGCKFADRCPYKMELCMKQNPKEYMVSQGHLVKCFLYSEQMLKGEEHE